MLKDIIQKQLNNRGPSLIERIVQRNKETISDDRNVPISDNRNIPNFSILDKYRSLSPAEKIIQEKEREFEKLKTGMKPTGEIYGEDDWRWVEEKSLKETFRESFRRGILRTGSALETILSVGADKIGAEQISKKLEKLSKQDAELAQVGVGIEDPRKFSEKVKDPQFIAKGIGETLPTMLFGLGVGLPAAAVGAPAAVVGGSIFSGTMALEAGFAYQDAKEFGADDETAEKVAGVVGVANGLLDAIPLTKLLSRSPAGKQIKRNIIAEITKRVFKQTTLESGTESLQEIVSNSVAKVYDEDRKLLDNVPEAAFFGGIMGGGFLFLMFL